MEQYYATSHIPDLLVEIVVVVYRVIWLSTWHCWQAATFLQVDTLYDASMMIDTYQSFGFRKQELPTQERAPHGELCPISFLKSHVSVSIFPHVDLDVSVIFPVPTSLLLITIVQSEPLNLINKRYQISWTNQIVTNAATPWIVHCTSQIWAPASTESLQSWCVYFSFYVPYHPDFEFNVLFCDV